MRRPAAAALLVALTLGCAAPLQGPVRRSGFEDMGTALQAMQRDDAANPAMLFVRDGERLWSTAPSAGARACSACHGGSTSLKGVAARYPAWDERGARPINLSGRINACRERHQGVPAWASENSDLLALEGWIALQSRGLPIEAASDRRLATHRERGAKAYARRMGQLDLSCAQCHDQLAGGRLAGSTIPQGHATGYPIYRLEWQGLGSLARRLRNCMTGVRAEPWPAGSVEMVELELYLAQRAAGMPLETPAVRP